MTLEDLAKNEFDLYNIVCSIGGSMEEKEAHIHGLDIYSKYKEIHREYAKLSKTNLEALKRGLFLMWYSMSEPSCFTGIKLLDLDSEEKIIRIIDRRLKRSITDYELEWMLDYYSNWEYAFERFSHYSEFQSRLGRELKTELPDRIDRNEMGSRGQMGLYWNLLTFFNKNTHS